MISRMIEIEHISKRYGEKLAVNDISFVVKPGMVTGFPRSQRCGQVDD